MLTPSVVVTEYTQTLGSVVNLFSEDTFGFWFKKIFECRSHKCNNIFCVLMCTVLCFKLFVNVVNKDNKKQICQTASLEIASCDQFKFLLN